MSKGFWSCMTIQNLGLHMWCYNKVYLGPNSTSIHWFFWKTGSKSSWCFRWLETVLLYSCHMSFSVWSCPAPRMNCRCRWSTTTGNWGFRFQVRLLVFPKRIMISGAFGNSPGFASPESSGGCKRARAQAQPRPAVQHMVWIGNAWSTTIREGIKRAGTWGEA